MVGAIVHAAEMLWALGLWLSVLIKVMGFVGEVADGIVLVVKLTVSMIAIALYGKESTVTRSSPKSAIAIMLTVSASTSKAAK